jgi:hypothetical protein
MVINVSQRSGFLFLIPLFFLKSQHSIASDIRSITVLGSSYGLFIHILLICLCYEYMGPVKMEENLEKTHAFVRFVMSGKADSPLVMNTY